MLFYTYCQAIKCLSFCDALLPPIDQKVISSTSVYAARDRRWKS